MFGDVSGASLADVLGQHDAETLATFRDRTRTGQRFTTEATLLTEDSEKQFVVELVPFWPGERPRSYVIYQDVTEIRRAG
jgi:hypothetical protein